MTKDLTRKLFFDFEGREYEIEFPTVGEYIEIENKKIQISKGFWSELLGARTISSLRSVQIIECISIISVLCPAILEDMKVDIKNIDILDFTKILKLYQDKIQGWYSNWFKNFNDVMNETNSLIEEVNKEEEEIEDIKEEKITNKTEEKKSPNITKGRVKKNKK